MTLGMQPRETLRFGFCYAAIPISLRRALVNKQSAVMPMRRLMRHTAARSQFLESLCKAKTCWLNTLSTSVPSRSNKKARTVFRGRSHPTLVNWLCDLLQCRTFHFFALPESWLAVIALTQEAIEPPVARHPSQSTGSVAKIWRQCGCIPRSVR